MILQDSAIPRDASPYPAALNRFTSNGCSAGLGRNGEVTLKALSNTEATL